MSSLDGVLAVPKWVTSMPIEYLAWHMGEASNWRKEKKGLTSFRRESNVEANSLAGTTN